MKKSKKSQINSHIVLYVLVGLISVVLLMALLKSLSDFSNRQDELLIKRFQEDLTEATATIDYGEKKPLDISTPSDATEVCFVDLTKSKEILKSPLIKRFPILKNSLQSGIRKNVFLISKDKIESMYGGDICFEQYPYFTCKKIARGKLNTYLEGKGKCVLVTSGLKLCTEIPQEVRDGTESLATNISIKTNDAELHIPEGITFSGWNTEETELCLGPISPPPPLDNDPDGLISEVYTITPENVTFSGDSLPNLSIKYYPDVLPQEFSSTKVKMRYYTPEDSAWTYVGGTVDSAGMKIKNAIETTRRYAVFGPEPPIAVIKVKTTTDPSYAEPPYIFDYTSQLVFDASDSTDPDGDTLEYEWNFSDGSPISNEMDPIHSYPGFGSYKVILRVTDQDGAQDKANATISLVNNNNNKNSAMYQDNIFIIESSATWQEQMRFIPLAMWDTISFTDALSRTQHGRIGYPYVIYTGSSPLPQEERDKLSDLYYPGSSNVVFVEGLPDTNEYFEYWSQYQEIAVMDYNANPDDALIAALFASFINVPIVFVNDVNIGGYISRINAADNKYIIGSISQSVRSQITPTIVDYTVADITGPPLNPYTEIYIETIPSRGLGS